MPSLQTDIVTDWVELDRLAGDWQRLWQSDPRATIFSSFAWTRAAWRAFERGRSLCSPVVRRDGRIVAILPLAAEAGVLRFIGWPRSDYNDLLAEPGAGPEVLAAALDAVNTSPVRWRRGELDNVPGASNLLALLPKVRVDRLCVRASLRADCPCVDLASDGPRIIADILAKKSLNRHERSLAALGNLTFRHIEDRDEIKSHLPDFFRQHTVRRAIEVNGGLFHDEAARAFYESLVDGLDPAGELRFAVLELAGQPIAYHFGFESRGTLLWYKPAFNVDYWDHSPGEVLIKRLFEYVRDRRLTRFDLAVGDEPFKSRFANRVEHNFTVHIHRRGIAATARMLAIGVQDAVRRRPALWRFARRTRAGLGELHAHCRRAIRRHGLLGALGKACSAAFRTTLFARDEVLVYSATGTANRLSPDDLKLTDAGLAGLAALAAEHGDFLTTNQLARARRRLSRGDRLHLAFKAGRLAHIAWTGVRTEIVADFETGPRCRMPLDQPGTLIYDCWTPPAMRGQGIYVAVLHALRASDPSQRFWIYCDRRNRASVRGIEKAGFRLAGRMRRTRLLHWIEFHKVAAIESSSQ